MRFCNQLWSLLISLPSSIFSKEPMNTASLSVSSIVFFTIWIKHFILRHKLRSSNIVLIKIISTIKFIKYLWKSTHMSLSSFHQWTIRFRMLFSFNLRIKKINCTLIKLFDSTVLKILIFTTSYLNQFLSFLALFQ